MVERPEYQSRPEMKSYGSFPSFQTVGEAPKGPLEKVLSYLADVRAGEGPGVLLLTANVFLLLAAYYLLKTAREALILTEGGAYIKAYSSAGQAVLLMILVPLYGMVGTRVVRGKLLPGLTLFFASHLAAFSFFGALGNRIGVVYYIWVGIFNVFVISQIWAFANDLYTESQGKRLFPLIGIGSSLGAWLGAEAAAQLVGHFQFSPYNLMLAALGILTLCAILTIVVNRRETSRASTEMAKHADMTLSAGNGFSLVFSSRYLILIAVLTVLLNIVNSSGEFILGKVVAEQAMATVGANPAAQKAFIGEFYGRFFSGVNLLGFLLQTFLVSRLFRYIGVRGAIFVLPCIALVSYSVLAAAPILAVVRVVKTLENATDYSVQNTVKQALFLPTSREEKYKAKAAIDTFFMRFGDVLQAGIVRFGAEINFATAGFAWLNIGFTILWLWIASKLSAAQRKMAF